MAFRKVTVDEEVLKLTNLEKVFWPERNYSKADLIKYYLNISEWILPYVSHRPIVMKRYPDGVQGKTFYQKRCPEYAPEWLETVEISGSEGTIRYCLCNDVPSLLWLINQGCIELHPWLSQASCLESPDVMVIDLDPDDSVGFLQVLEVALVVKECLHLLSLEGFPKTSGKTGLHIYIPLKHRYTYEEVRTAARFIAQLVTKTRPDISTIERDVKKRTGKVYVDYLQNAKGKTIASVYSVRPTSVASVSTPVTWDEVERKAIFPERFTMKNIHKRLESLGDIYSASLTTEFSIDHVLKNFYN